MPSASAPFSAPAYVFKLTFSGQIPPLKAGPLPTSWVKIGNVANGLALDSGGGVASGSVVKQWTFTDGSANLQWQLAEAGNGYHRIVNRTNGMVIDSLGDATAGANPRQAAWSGSNNQQWKISDIGNGRYTIANRSTGTYLDSGGDVSVGTAVKLWPADSSSNLQWSITSI